MTIMIRINELVKCIDGFKCLADVGCDHGYLIIESLKMFDLDEAIAIDNKKGPLSQAMININNSGYGSKVKFSLSSGIKEISYKTDVVVIAGMGGMLISDILNDDLKNVKRLVLQPNRDIKEVRCKISNLGFNISLEKIVYENDKYYEILVCDKNDIKVLYTDEELEFGPYLLKHKDEMFINKWHNELLKLKNIKKFNQVNEDLDKKIERIEKILC